MSSGQHIVRFTITLLCRFHTNSYGTYLWVPFIHFFEGNSGGPVEDSRYVEPPLKVSGDADRYHYRDDTDYYSQLCALFRLMNDDQKAQLFSNLAEAMNDVPERIAAHQLVHFSKADPDYGRGVAQKLGVDMDRFAPWASLSLVELTEKTSAASYTG